MHHCATKNSIVDVHTVGGGTAKVPPAKKRSLFDLDVLYHPVRMKQAVFDQFLSGFDKIYERRDQEAESFRRHKYTGTYFIGRKKAAPCTSLIDTSEPPYY